MGNYSAKQRKRTVEIDGVKDLLKALKKMEDKAADVLLKAADDGGEIALAYAIENCPVDTGTLKKSLQKKSGKVERLRADIQIGFDKDGYYSKFVELGTKNQEAKPFMRQAIDKNEQNINKTVVDTIVDSVMKGWNGG